MKEVSEILNQIKKGSIKPVYIFDGEDPYYMDVLTDAFEKNILNESEKDFNYKVFYGKDASYSAIINECRSFPVFAQKRLIILKEASQLKDFEKLEGYLRNPADSTLLVIAHKYKKLDGRTLLVKTIKSKELKDKIAYLTFDKIKDHQIAPWIMQYCKEQKININTYNTELLAAYLGNDLQKIVNEIEKIRINLKEGDEITSSLIEKYIGISKEYNVFQYPKAIIEHNAALTYRITNYYIANPKETPLVVITAMLYNEFSKLYRYHYAKNLPQIEIAKAIGIAPFFVKDYQKAAFNYSLEKTIKAIDIIQEYNLKAVGVHIANNNMSLLKELSFKLLSL